MNVHNLLLLASFIIVTTMTNLHLFIPSLEFQLVASIINLPARLALSTTLQVEV
ncbi:hypothetical protein [Alkalihalobacillus deserti]|uniref:hypothetical protein n=1 Tax=Alkalihalobacillus deserti TaxID=2879466 RepID=UPI001D142632|nr:hypothetical protein [Alkalihalobacillus deserti]